MRAEAPQIVGQDRAHRRRRDTERVKALGAGRDHVVGIEVADLVEGQHLVRDEPAGQPLHRVARDAEHRGDEARQVQHQTTTVDHRQHALHQLLEGLDVGAAQFEDALRLAQNALHRGLRHVIDIDRLEAGVATGDRQDRAEFRHRGEFVEELVFGAEDHRGAQDHRRRKGLEHRGLARRLGAAVVAVRAGIGTKRRDMHQPLDPGFRRDLGDALCAFGMDRAKAVLAAAEQDAHAVHHRVGPVHRGPHARLVADVAQHRLELADRTIGLHEKRLVRAAAGDAHTPALFRHAAGDVPPDESRTAIDRDQLRHRLRPLAEKKSHPDYRQPPCQTRP
ncbi:hypothetical protein SDC9_06474 [bioreactor metagenome]|uniref:Uncharacterized protein n=1 Tax=bioreactor metagenome TaxID=1076179 RepID=A0A644T1X2_9ZZZZ